MSAQAPPSAAVEAVLAFADDELVLGWRDSEWTGVAPFLEEDVAFSSIAQGEIGHARALYELVAGVQGGDADALAFDRAPEEYRCAPVRRAAARRRLGAPRSRATGSTRRADAIRVKALMESDWPELAGLAAKMDREEHLPPHARAHVAEKLEGNEQFEAAVAELWPYALGVLEPSQRGELAKLVGRDEVEAVERGSACRRLRGAARRDDDGAPLDPRCGMVTAEKVWAALAELPDPEIPVISLVDLGVVRDVEVEARPRARRVHAHVPRLPGPGGHARPDGRRRARPRRRAGDRRRPRRLLVDRPHHARGPPQAAGVRLRPAGAADSDRPDARPARGARLPLPVLRLHRHAPGEPLRPHAVPLDPLLRRAAGSRSSSSRRSSPSERPARIRRGPLRQPCYGAALPLGFTIQRPLPMSLAKMSAVGPDRHAPDVRERKRARAVRDELPDQRRGRLSACRRHRGRSRRSRSSTTSCRPGRRGSRCCGSSNRPAAPEAHGRSARRRTSPPACPIFAS